MVKLILDGNETEAPEGANLLKVCHESGVYIPSLCYHPDLPPFSGCTPSNIVHRPEEILKDNPGAASPSPCGLCVVEIEGEDAPVFACETTVTEGMHINTDTPEIQKLRGENLSAILAGHPRLCLVCPHSDGCDRLNCSLGTPEDQRCCSKFNNCELREIAQYIGINRGIPEYVPTSIPKIKGGKLFEFDLNLCIGCLRCIRACRNLQEIGAIGYVRNGRRAVVGTMDRSLPKSGCKFCGACVAVCPTGAMVSTSEKCGEKLTLSGVMMPPLPYLDFAEKIVDEVPEEEGVIQIFDTQTDLIYIAGASNMRKELKACLKTADGARYFIYEKDAMFTQRQNELIQHHIDTYGKQPRINEEIDDLF
jgi:predicted molibdopterin-dependent oxidoreductase YjgC